MARQGTYALCLLVKVQSCPVHMTRLGAMTGVAWLQVLYIFGECALILMIARMYHVKATDSANDGGEKLAHCWASLMLVAYLLAVPLSCRCGVTGCVWAQGYWWAMIIAFIILLYGFARSFASAVMALIVGKISSVVAQTTN